MTTMFEEHEVEKLRNIMENFVHISGGKEASTAHPENRLERIESKIERLSDSMHAIEIAVSNAQLVQKGVLWLGGIIGSSAVVMAMTFLFKGI